MSNGLVFFSDWANPCPLLAVALHSLERYYRGNVHVIYGKNTPEFFSNALKKNKRVTSSLYIPDYSLAPWAHNSYHQCWSLKPIIHQASPFKTTVLYDCDHVFVAPYDVSIFDVVNKNGLISFHHSREKMTNRDWRKANSRASVIRNVIGLPCNDGELLKVNGGCVGSVRGTPLLKEWMFNLEKFALCGNRVITRLPDEFSLSYTMARHKILVGDDKWSYSPAKDLSDLSPLPPVSAIHFCGGSYRRGKIFAQSLKLAKNDNFMDLKTNWEQYRQSNPLIEEAEKLV